MLGSQRVFQKTSLPLKNARCTPALRAASTLARCAPDQYSSCPTDKKVRWVIVRDAHLNGPWGYCHQLRDLVGGREPVARYPDLPAKGIAQVYVFDLESGVADASSTLMR